jgi:uncharacterized protein (DUF2249 family)
MINVMIDILYHVRRIVSDLNTLKDGKRLRVISDQRVS